ncbi:hypothetical protein NJBCHELONAE_09900, partial [Mycobacteroides chelonae]
SGFGECCHGGHSRSRRGLRGCSRRHRCQGRCTGRRCGQVDGGRGIG